VLGCFGWVLDNFLYLQYNIKINNKNCMILPFPSRFFKKLEIYQQIRSGQGIAKYKYLWRYESAFLQYSYEEDHQHLNSFINSHNFKKWVQKIIPDKEIVGLNRVIGNLFWRGFIEIQKNESKSVVSELITRNDFAIPNDFLANNYRFRVTQLGHNVGEVISEVESKNWLIAYFNRYKYSIIFDLFWLFVLLAAFSLFHIIDDVIVIFNAYSFLSSPLIKIIIMLLFVFILWPLLLAILRWIKRKIENCKKHYTRKIMNKKIAKTIWVIIVALFLALQVYNYQQRNFDDLTITMLIVIIPLAVIGGFYFYNNNK